MQANQLKSLAVGELHPTVISFDMALYERAIQLVDLRRDLKETVVPRLGELHVVMAALRALGASIENSGIDDAWIEADVYGTATTRQILKCSHYKRSLRAHIYSYMALYEIIVDEFFVQNPHLKRGCLEATEKVEVAVAKGKLVKAECVKQAHSDLLDVLTSSDVLETFRQWEEQKSDNAMFKSIMNYLHRVESILLFVAASRNADISLHLQAGEALSSLFFAMDRMKYKRLWHRYLADMYDLQTHHPETWKELETGNLSVTKNGIPFTSLGADHACEQLNKLMKVSSGLIGISNNANARQRFFMATPELSCITKELFKDQFSLGGDSYSEHHGLRPSAVRRDQETVKKIKTAILSHGNPCHTEGDKLHNMITHACVPQQYVTKILDMDKTGQSLYEEFVTERINGNVSLWAPLKRQNNQMFKSGNKNIAVKIRDRMVDLKETKDLYGRLLVLSRSNRQVNLKEAIGNHEFTLTPRAFFAPDGTVLACTDKSKLIHALQKLKSESSISNANQVTTEPLLLTDRAYNNPSRKVALVDGMVLVQTLSKKPATMLTVKDLGVWFNDKLSSLTRDYDETILVFDTYKIGSLKNATRERRRQGKDPVQYQVRDETSLKSIALSRFLSHDQTKAELTEYLAEKVLEYNRTSDKLVIVSSSGTTKCNRQMSFFDNNHEEADTLLIYQAVLATQRNPIDTQLMFFSPDTDVLVLVISNYEKLPQNTSISMVSGIVEIKPIWHSLGVERARTLAAFHSFTGTDNVGRFSRVGKSTWMKTYMDIDDDVVKSLQVLTNVAEVTDELLYSLSRFVCAAYCPKGIQIHSIPELRWFLFCKLMAESDKLPPTLGALKQHVLRVNLQARVWSQACIARQDFIDPLMHGFDKDRLGQLKPKTTDVLLAPEAIIEMVRCRCKTDCSSARCTCKSKDLCCTDLCQCNSECQNDEDIQNASVLEDSDEDDL